ncbi:MAG: SDR family oxidoreductase [Bryobacteraceae bacterium]|nr:SDR family oxidoreductase [Bryobacteraceae bacterium]
MDFRLEGKAALITGGGSGIGLAIAHAFQEQGCRVTIGDLPDKAGIAEGCGAQFQPLDVTSDASVLAAVQRSGPIQVLVNCAGIMHVGKLHETSWDDYDQVQAVNARGTYLCCRAVIDGMLAAGGGNIINLASVASLIAVERRFAYCVSKGAVLSLTRAIAIDYAAQGIRANAICPGTVDTPMIRGYVDKYFGDDVPGTLAALHARQPVGRMGTVAEIASLAVYLASDESRYLTGAAIPIDGGWTAK